MNNLRYAINGVLKKPIFLVITIIQLTVSMCFFSLVISNKISIEETSSRLSKVFKNLKIYTLTDRSNEDALFKNKLKKDDSIAKLNEFYTFLNENKNFKFVSYYTSHIEINKFYGGNEFYWNKSITGLLKNQIGTFSPLKSMYVDENFQKNFKLQVGEGRSFNNSDFKNSKVTSIILGDNYHSIYKVGDILQYYNYTNKTISKLKVIGFLKKDYYFIENVNFIDLNNYILLPLYNNVMSAYSQEAIIPEFDNRIFHSLIITSNMKKTYKLIEDKSNKLSLYTLSMNSYNDKVKLYNELMESNLKQLSLISIIIVVFTSISIITSMLSLIKKCNKEYGVHLLSGATINDIAIRVVIMVLFYIVVSLIISTFCVQFMLPHLGFSISDYKFLIYLIIIDLNLVAIISFIPTRKILKTDISLIIRRKE